jgi:ribonuclease BN (tRNA processing enzyme)
MKLTFLGTGSAFTIGANNYHSNMLLENDAKERLLIDCGSDARFSLYEQGFSFRDIEDVYISHLHADHAGGLEWLAFSRHFDEDCDKPTLHICETLVDDLWNKVLSGGLSSLQATIANLSTYFNIDPIKVNSTFRWKKLELRIVQTVHIMSGYTLVPSYGLLFEADGLKVFITTDTQFCPHQIMDFYHEADIIFHDCEISKKLSGVHANYRELKTLSPELRKKIWLYHYNPEELPDAKKDGFRGFVKKGQCFNFKDPNSLV